MIPSQKLQHVVALAEHGSFRTAAKELNLTQPALSRSIQSLERALGVRLFDRDRAGVEITAAGGLVVERAREIVLAIAELEHEVELVESLGAGTLEVGLAPYPSAISGQSAVSALLGEHPDIQCRVRVAGFAEVADDVVSGRCEIGMSDLGGASRRGLSMEPLVDRPLAFFARPRHPLVSRRRCTLADLLRFPWAGIRAPVRIASHLPADVHRAGRWDRGTGEFVPAFEGNVVSEFLALARDSDVLAAATFTLAETDLAEHRVAAVRFAAPWLRLGYGFISRPGRTLSASSRRFMEIVRDLETDLDERERAVRARFLPRS